MTRRLALAISIALIVSSPAFAQMGGGMGGMGGGMGGMGGGGMGGGGRHGGGGQSNAPSSTSSARPTRTVNLPPETPMNKIEIVGVIRSIDRTAGRVTIAYEAVDELNWEHGEMPFPVADTALLEGASVGEKVRFKVDSHEIYVMTPY